ncbi:MAG: hypothetical protein ACNA8J_02505 [Gammaproteobacteria bacterium]
MNEWLKLMLEEIRRKEREREEALQEREHRTAVGTVRRADPGKPRSAANVAAVRRD